MRCPKCGHSLVRRSHRASLWDNLASLLFFSPYRCRKCGHRFFSARDRLRKLKYATCPHCANQDLQLIPPSKVHTRWFKAATRLIRRRAYRCDICRLRFFDMRAPMPRVLPAESAASGEIHPAASR